MLRNGSYSAWYRTRLREGTGVVVLNDGKITGGDASLTYTGHTSRTAINFRLLLRRGGTRQARRRFLASTTSI